MQHQQGERAKKDRSDRFSSPLFGLAIAVFVLVASPATTLYAEENTMLLADHPLAGSLWHMATKEKTDVNRLRADVEATDHLLLGEKHDNIAHHDRQALMVSMLREAGKSGVLVMEMAEQKHRKVLAELEPEGLDGLGDAIEWQQRGWGDWRDYQPIAEEGYAAGMRLKPGNPDRETLMSVGRGGELTKDQLEDLHWDVDYNDADRESLLDELVDAHCGMMGRESMGSLVRLQRLKDAFMAREMRQTRTDGEVSVLIAGNGHVRKDRGVPMFLNEDDSVLSVALVEVVRDETDPNRYPSFNASLYDYVWFTPRVDEIDPCEKFRKQLERMKGKIEGHGKKAK